MQVRSFDVEALDEWEKMKQQQPEKRQKQDEGGQEHVESQSEWVESENAMEKRRADWHCLRNSRERKVKEKMGKKDNVKSKVWQKNVAG